MGDLALTSHIRTVLSRLRDKYGEVKQGNIGKEK